MFPAWRHHPFLTNSTESTPQADLTHRRHAIIETAHSDLIGGRHAPARGATLRRHLVTVPGRLARPAGRRVLPLPAHWPGADHWTTLWNAGTGPPTAS